MNDLQHAYNKLDIPGRDIAEIEIEARRDAQESQTLSSRDCPYETGSFAALVYLDELTKMRFNDGL